MQSYLLCGQTEFPYQTYRGTPPPCLRPPSSISCLSRPLLPSFLLPSLPVGGAEELHALTGQKGCRRSGPTCRERDRRAQVRISGTDTLPSDVEDKAAVSSKLKFQRHGFLFAEVWRLRSGVRGLPAEV